MKLTKVIITAISVLAVSVSVFAQQPPPPPGGPDVPPPGGPGGPPPGGTGGPPPGGPDGLGGPNDGMDEDMPSKEEVIAAVGPACAQYVPDEPPSDFAAFLEVVPDNCKSAFAALIE